MACLWEELTNVVYSNINSLAIKDDFSVSLHLRHYRNPNAKTTIRSIIEATCVTLQSNKFGS